MLIAVTIALWCLFGKEVFSGSHGILVRNDAGIGSTIFTIQDNRRKSAKMIEAFVSSYMLDLSSRNPSPNGPLRRYFITG
uniref:Uncharacterized protein n=1 Tax=Utricularia reniformis TaxID=192314 RepID=A0A1Y0AZW0_9LAMI|nr:hypothetical protein AEK19_MT0406 [Utricularia reniformis]ART30674.1 hypothetical protein AEK19_MT0406 [Utricularia reniformis]